MDIYVDVEVQICVDDNMDSDIDYETEPSFYMYLY